MMNNKGTENWWDEWLGTRWDIDDIVAHGDEPWSIELETYSFALNLENETGGTTKRMRERIETNPALVMKCVGKGFAKVVGSLDWEDEKGVFDANFAALLAEKMMWMSQMLK